MIFVHKIFMWGDVTSSCTRKRALANKTHSQTKKGTLISGSIVLVQIETWIHTRLRHDGQSSVFINLGGQFHVGAPAKFNMNR